MRADTLEALRKLDQQFGRLERARRYAPRPYEIVVLSDHGQTQGATFKQRNGYGLDELVQRSLGSGSVTGVAGGDEQDAMVKHAMGEATGRKPEKRPKNDVSDRDVVVLGSGNLGLVYLMEEPRRLTLEEIDERHPELLPALRGHPHVGWLLVRSATHGAVVLGGGGGARYLDEACAFEELISFHGGLGGPQTRGFILHPPHLEVPPEGVIGAEALHSVLSGWRSQLQAAPALGAPARTGAREVSGHA
jgi:hypothetical protein